MTQDIKDDALNDVEDNETDLENSSVADDFDDQNFEAEFEEFETDGFAPPNKTPKPPSTGDVSDVSACKVSDFRKDGSSWFVDDVLTVEEKGLSITSFCEPRSSFLTGCNAA